MSPEHQLHTQASTLRIKEHNAVLCKQYPLNICHLDTPEREYPTLRTAFSNIYKNRCTGRQSLNDIQRESINTFLSSLPTNGVLGVKPRLIAEEELELPRESRVILAQLTSGYCSRSNCYLSRLDPNIPNICPACNEFPHDTKHYLAWQLKPINLTPLSLWSEPFGTARLLDLPIDDYVDLN